jgi:hypothetical protein
VAKGRYVLRYRGGDAGPAGLDAAQLTGLAGVTILDSSPRMFLVEAEHEPLRQLVDTLPDWVMAPEQSYDVPDTRMKVERPPE